VGASNASRRARCERPALIVRIEAHLLLRRTFTLRILKAPQIHIFSKFYASAVPSPYNGLYHRRALSLHCPLNAPPPSHFQKPPPPPHPVPPHFPHVLKSHHLTHILYLKVGELLVLMVAPQGPKTLADHPTNVMEAASMRDTAIYGCLIVYCGGCVRAIEDRLQDVAQSFADSLGGGSVDGKGGGTPFLGMFTYGEQCRTPSGENRHVNLMYAVLAFCEE